MSFINNKKIKGILHRGAPDSYRKEWPSYFNNVKNNLKLKKPN